MKQKRTMDNGEFDEALKDPRRCPTLKQKLEVLDFVEDLRKKKEKAKEDYLTPRPAHMTRAQAKEFYQKKRHAKKQMRINIQKSAQGAFPLFMGRSQVCKWRQACERESWRQMPESVLARVSTTNNTWRLKLGLPRRGHPYFGRIPMCLQKELDLLMIEHSSGLSDVSERKELVTAEQVAARPQTIHLCLLHSGKYTWNSNFTPTSWSKTTQCFDPTLLQFHFA